MGLEVGQVPLSDEQILALAEEAGLTEAEAISLLLRGPQGPMAVTEPFFPGTHNHAPSARRPKQLAKQLAKQRAKNKVAKRSRRTNRSSK
jgi:hypothetical protein